MEASSRRGIKSSKRKKKLLPSQRQGELQETINPYEKR